jgi:hypothetical protein
VVVVVVVVVVLLLLLLRLLQGVCPALLLPVDRHVQVHG